MNRATAALLIGVVGLSAGIFLASRAGTRRVEERRTSALGLAWQDYATCTFGGALEEGETIGERTARLRVDTSDVDPERTEAWLRMCDAKGYADKLQKAARGVHGAEALQPTYASAGDEHVLEGQYATAKKLGLPMEKSPRLPGPKLPPRRPLPISAVPFHGFDPDALMAERMHHRAYFARKTSLDGGVDATVRACSFKDGSCTDEMPSPPIDFLELATSATPDIVAFPTTAGDLLDGRTGRSLARWKPVFPFSPDHFVHDAHVVDASLAGRELVRWADGKVKARLPLEGRLWLFDEWAIAERSGRFEVFPLPRDGSLPRPANVVAAFSPVGSPQFYAPTCDSKTSSAVVFETPAGFAVLARTGSRWQRGDVVSSKPARDPLDDKPSPRRELPVLRCGDRRVTVLGRNGNTSTLSVDGVECTDAGCASLAVSVTRRASQSQPREVAFLGEDAVVAMTSADGLVVRRGKLTALGNAKEELVVFSPGLAQNAWPWLLQDGDDVLVFLFPFDDSRSSARGVVLHPDGTFSPMNPRKVPD